MEGVCGRAVLKTSAWGRLQPAMWARPQQASWGEDQQRSRLPPACRVEPGEGPYQGGHTGRGWVWTRERAIATESGAGGRLNETKLQSRLGCGIPRPTSPTAAPLLSV